MTMKTLQPLWTACHSSLKLDQLLHGELAETEAPTLRAHVACCSQCQAAVDHLRAAQAEALPPLTAKPPLLKLVRDVPRAPIAAAIAAPAPAPIAAPVATAPTAPPAAIPPRERSRTSAWAKSFSLVSGLAAAAAAILVLSPAPGERSKGSKAFSLGMYVQHGEEVRRAGPGDPVHPGDAVRFSLRAPADGFAAVLSRDPRGHASIYFPAGSRAAAVGAGSDTALPLSTRLDESVGTEQLLGLFCDRAVELEPIRAGLEQATPAIPEGCQTSQWSFEKR
jgi:hypothetical protein